MRGPYLIDSGENIFKGNSLQNYGVGPYFRGTSIFVPMLYWDAANTKRIVVMVSTNETAWATYIVYSFASSFNSLPGFGCSRFGDVLYFAFYDNNGVDLVPAWASFDMAALTASGATKRTGGPPFDPIIGSASHTSETADGFGGFVKFPLDRAEDRFQCEATAASQLSLIAQHNKQNTVGKGAAVNYADYAGGAWLQTTASVVFGHGNGRPSNLLAGAVTVSGFIHQFFVSGDGRLFHQNVGFGGVQEITTVFNPGDANTGAVSWNRTGDVIGQPVYDATLNQILVPFKNASGRIAAAYATPGINPAWTVETVDSTVSMYEQFQGGASSFSAEYPTPCAAAVIDGEWNVFFIDNANRKGLGDTPGVGNGNLQKVYRAIKSGGVWGAPTVFYSALVWINAVDVRVDAANGRFAVLLAINAPSFLNPWIAFENFTTGVALNLGAGISSGTALGRWSGLTGGVFKQGCGAGLTPPRGGNSGRGCGSPYSAQ